MAFLVYFLAWKNGVSPIRLILVGIGVMSLTKALTTLLMILGPIYQASQANIWITGTVYGSTWKNVGILVPWTVILVIIAFLYARNVNIQELGDEVATGLGGHLQKQRFTLMMLCTGLVGGSVAFAGAIGFVGLMAPHMAITGGFRIWSVITCICTAGRNFGDGCKFGWSNVVFTTRNTCGCLYGRHRGAIFYILII